MVTGSTLALALLSRWGSMIEAVEDPRPKKIPVGDEATVADGDVGAESLFRTSLV